MSFLSFPVLLLASFLAGSIPSAWIAVRLLKGQNISELGSGNPGATNVFRVAGWKAALPVFLVDFMKGFLPVFLASSGMLPRFWNLSSSTVALAAGTASVLGHVFSPWMRFRGGKGVATGAGMFTALSPPSAIVCALVFSAVLGLSRRMSLASLSAAVALPVSLFVLPRMLGEMPDYAVFVFGSAISLGVFLRHRRNISKLIQGLEAPLF